LKGVFNKDLEDFREEWEGDADSVFIEDIKDNDKLSSEVTEVDKGNSTDFNEVLVSL